jgi:hypothetical protein
MRAQPDLDDVGQEAMTVGLTCRRLGKPQTRVAVVGWKGNWERKNFGVVVKG